MNHDQNASLPKSLLAKLAGVVSVAVLSGCAAMEPAAFQDAGSAYRGAALEPDLGSVALLLAETAAPLRDERGG